MTSSNDTGQGIGSTATEIGDDVDPSSNRDDSPGPERSGDADGAAATDARTSDSGKKDKDATAPGPDAPTGGQASKKTTEQSAKPAATGSTDAVEKDVPDPEADSAETAAEAAKEKPIPGGIWRSAYEAGAAAPSSRYVVSAPKTETEEEPAAKSESSLGSAVAKASKPQDAASSDDSEVDDSTHPRNVPSPTASPAPASAPKPPSDAWQRVPASKADADSTATASNVTDSDARTGDGSASSGAAPIAGAAAAGAATGAAASGGAAETTANVKQGAVKAAQAALAAARNAAKKVSAAKPESSSPANGATQEQTAATPPAPPEMHYTAGAVRGTASVPEEATVPVRPNETPGASDGDTVPGHEPSSAPRTPGGPRRVRLAISRIDPWSVMKLAFLLSVAIAIMTVVATAVFWSVIDSLGVFAAVEQFVIDAIGSGTQVDVMQYVEFERVVSLSTLVAICNVVLMTALATILTFLYNITSALVGGVHMTLTDD